MAPHKQKLMIPGSINAAQIPELQRWLESDVLSEKAKHRLRCILYFFEHNASLEETAKQFSTTPNSVRRWIATFDVTNPASLEEKSRRRKTPTTSHVSEDTLELIRTYRREAPRMGKREIAHALKQDHGITLSASTVGRVIEREGLYFGESPLHQRKRFAQSSPILAPETPVPEREPVAAAVPTSRPSRWLIAGMAAVAVFVATLTGYELHAWRAELTHTNASSIDAPVITSTNDSSFYFLKP